MMKTEKQDFNNRVHSYLASLNNSFNPEIISVIENLARELLDAWITRRNVFICGNGGSAANAIHMANDFHYGIGCATSKDNSEINGLKVEALPANVGILTCLANDTSYEHVYSQQLKVKAEPKDILIVLSGSGNSPNVVNAIKVGKEIGMKSYAIVAFNGGQCKKLADQPIHFEINDMQIAEDTQLIVGHLCMQWLNSNKQFKSQKLENARN